MAKRRFDGFVWLVLAILVVALPIAACSSDNSGGGSDSGSLTAG